MSRKLSDLPSDAVRLCSYDIPGRGKDDGHSHEYKLLYKAATEGHIDMIVWGTRKFVSKSQADRYLARAAKAAAKSPVAPDHAEPQSMTTEILDRLERIERKFSALLDELGCKIDGQAAPQ